MDVVATSELAVLEGSPLLEEWGIPPISLLLMLR